MSVLTCRSCGQQFPHLTGLREHVASAHPGVLPGPEKPRQAEIVAWRPDAPSGPPQAGVERWLDGVYLGKAYALAH